MTAPVAVVPADPRDARPRALLEASHALMRALFPAESNHFLDIEALAAPDIRFFAAERGGATLGCGALAIRKGYGEVKSMFVASDARGAGVAGLILDRIEAEARAEALPLLRLETGDALTSAHALYERKGFHRRGPFGAYAEDPHSVFMEKRL